MSGLRASALEATAHDELFALYRELHQNPELSLAEFETARRMAEQLRSLGFEVTTGIGGTGLVGILRNGEGPVVALRADMDALPVFEETGLEYASTVRTHDASGAEVAVMHACGHDIHMTALLGAARVISESRSQWNGTAIMLFQPAEEIAQGAKAMVADNLFGQIPRPDVILGQHVGNLPLGVVSYTVGPAMAAADSLRVVITGRGAHGSRPEASIDPIVIASSIVMRLQSIVAREIKPADIAVVTVGSLHAGTKENIIPATAELKLNLRSMTPAVRQKLLAAVTRIVNAECAASGSDATATIEPIGSFPRLVNAEEPARRTVRALSAALGADQVRPVAPVTISEDFGLLAEQAGIPAFFWFFGSTDPERYAAAERDDAVDARIPANHSALFAPSDPLATILSGADALVIAFSEWIGATTTA